MVPQTSHQGWRRSQGSLPRLRTGGFANVAGGLRRALAADLPTTAKEAGYVTDGYSARLDDARIEATRNQDAIDELQARYVTKTGIKGLRIKVNTLVGYHVEVPSAQAATLGGSFTLRQGLASSARFTTPELDALASRLEEASARVAIAEQAVFTELSNSVLDIRESLSKVAHAAARAGSRRRSRSGGGRGAVDGAGTGRRRRARH